MRLPKGWHPQAARRGTSALSWRPGWRGSGQQPVRRPPVSLYTSRVTSVPLTGGQAQGTIASGDCTLTVGPQALGTVWYPVQVTLSTTTGVLDTSVAQVWLGAQGTPVTLVGQVYSGNGTVALAIPDMTPGQALITTWTGGHDGDTAAVNVTGTMDAITMGAGS